MYNLKQIALKNIPLPSSKETILYPDGGTEDIVNTILLADKLSGEYTKTFAPHLKAKTVYETAKNVFDFAFNSIRYQLDPLGEQYIKSPAQTMHDGFGDCKSFSVFTASIFKNLGIPYAYRFVSYTSSPTWTHVYVIVYSSSGEIIVDPVYKKFNQEKSYTHKIDYPMTKISYVAGPFQRLKKLHNKVVQMHTLRPVPNRKKKKKLFFSLGSPESRLSFSKDIDNVSEAEMDLKIAQQRLAIERDIVAGMSGIGSVKTEKYNDALDMISDAVGVVEDDSLTEDEKIAELGRIDEDAEDGEYDLSSKIAGIGDIGKRKSARKQKKAERKAARKQKKAVKKAARKEKKKKNSAKRKAFIKKVGNKIKKGAKAVVKIATAPQRLLVKGVLEVMLPKTAPLFLYVFLPEEAAKKAPAKVQRKRAKAMKVKKFIVDVIGMKESHFNGIVRNGITKRYKRSPEAVLSKFTQGVSGIGVAPLVALIPALIGMISKLAALFKKKDKPDYGNDDVPDESDFAGANESNKSAVRKNLRETNPSPTSKDIAEGNGGSRYATGMCGGKKKEAAPEEEAE